MHFIANEILKKTYVNVMSQYRPCGHAKEIDAIAVGITPGEYKAAVKEAQNQGIKRLDGHIRR
jgi:putative pyruvate formate lyase activating enzyme